MNSDVWFLARKPALGSIETPLRLNLICSAFVDRAWISLHLRPDATATRKAVRFDKSNMLKEPNGELSAAMDLSTIGKSHSGRNFLMGGRSLNIPFIKLDKHELWDTEVPSGRPWCTALIADR